ncbi:MAG TPA: hypothetical protein VLK25_08570 [Allosphingosinicella sp.]|nr:hypothetical protein [Allosphingosinicella sp.]
MIHRFACLAAALSLAGCAAQGPFPSLAPRPAEQMDMSVDPVRPDPVIADDPALAQQLAGLVAEARAGWRDFETEAGPAARAVAASGPSGSDSWVVAQQAISRLEAARARTQAARSDLDRLALERQDQPTSPADRQAIEAAIAETEAIAAREQNRLEEIRRD